MPWEIARLAMALNNATTISVRLLRLAFRFGASQMPSSREILLLEIPTVP
jgi:hypothetical protein